MQLRLWAAAAIYLGSYLPLSFILLAQDFRYDCSQSIFTLDNIKSYFFNVPPFNHTALSLSIFGVCLLGMMFSAFIFRVTKYKRTIKIRKLKYIPSELMNYTLPYIVSFMGIGYNDGSKLVGIIIFLIWIFWITYKSGQIILNPMLVVFGWRLYEVSFSYGIEEQEHDGFILSNEYFEVNDVLKYSDVQDVMIARKP